MNGQIDEKYRYRESGSPTLKGMDHE